MNAQKSTGKKIGCWLLSIFLFFVWLAVAWALWIGSFRQPESDEMPTFFEIIPGSTDNSHIESDEEAQSNPENFRK